MQVVINTILHPTANLRQSMAVVDNDFIKISFLYTQWLPLDTRTHMLLKYAFSRLPNVRKCLFKRRILLKAIGHKTECITAFCTLMEYVF